MRPAMVTVPVRDAPLFVAAVTVTDPFPAPGAPLVTLSHGSFAAAVHEHHDWPETENASAPPPEAIAWLMARPTDCTAPRPARR